MKQLLTIFVLLSFNPAYSQDNCEAIIYWKYLKPISIYDKPNGKIICQVKNDKETEDYLHLKILDQTNSHFYVSISPNIKKEEKKGWIKKAEYIGAFAKHEQSPMDLIIYKDKEISEQSKIQIKTWTPGLITIEKFSGTWVFISLDHKGKKFKGWIETDKLCANNYSSCS